MKAQNWRLFGVGLTFMNGERTFYKLGRSQGQEWMDVQEIKNSGGVVTIQFVNYQGLKGLMVYLRKNLAGVDEIFAPVQDPISIQEPAKPMAPVEAPVVSAEPTT